MVSRRSFGFLAAGSALTGWRVNAQEAMDDRALFLRGNMYLPHYLALKSLADTGDGSAVAMLSQHAAFVGDEAAATAERQFSSPIPDALKLTSEPAVAAIVERARDAQIVILNESHSISGHRAFAGRILRALRPLGFEVFAAETFTWDHAQSDLVVQDLKPGSAFLPRYGYYSRDPVYAEIVRDALGLGYRLAGYEQTQTQRPISPAASADDQINAREEAQALNFIANILKPNPSARIFVLCGYSHVTEEPMDRREWFASRLKRMSGIDPLTIEQSFNWPAFDPNNDPSPTRTVLDRFAPSEPVAVFESSGRAFTTDPYSGRVDLSVYHPRLDRVSGRPGWLAAEPGRVAREVSFVASSEIALLQAVRISEGMGAIPSDQVLVAPEQTSATLFLPPGDYLLRYELRDGWRVLGSLTIAM